MARPLNINIPAFNLTISSLFRNPSLLLPHLTISTIQQLPAETDLGAHLLPTGSNHHRTPRNLQHPKIRALVIDKDNTLTPPDASTLPASYFEKLKALRTNASSPFNLSTNPYGVLIVSNTAGSNPAEPIYEVEAQYLESRLYELRVPVFRASSGHSSEKAGSNNSNSRSKRTPLKKPFCYPAILEYLRERGAVERPDEIAVVGDRLGTDVLMASLMGAWSVWVRDGVTVGAEGDDEGREGMDYRGPLSRAEAQLERYLRRRGVKPKLPPAWAVEEVEAKESNV